MPVALVDRCTGTLNEPILPFTKVWATVRGERSARFALPLCAPTNVPGEPQVLVRHPPNERTHDEPVAAVIASRSAFCDPAAPECVEYLAAMVAFEKDHQPLPVVFADVLAPSDLHAATRRLLLEAVSARTGIAADKLVEDGSNPWIGGPYALNATGGVVYIAREGRYWRRGRREKEFTPVSNFMLRLVDDHLDAKGNVTHDARLEVVERSVEASFSSAVLDSPKRLLTALTRVATSAGLDYPIISDSKAKRLMPDLIKATQPCPARVSTSASVPGPRTARA